METKVKNKFTKKLILALLLILIIISTAFIGNAFAEYTDEMKSESDFDGIGSEIGDKAPISLQDMKKYYSILCCEHGRLLASSSKVTLTVSYGGNTYTYNTGDITANDKGKELFRHRVSSTSGYTSNFDKSSYISYNWGNYTVVDKVIAAPKEAYILAEMKEELNAPNEVDYVLELDEAGNRVKYYGQVYESESYQLSSGQTIYYVNHKYVLETDQGVYKVKLKHDDKGQPYYLYDVDYDGALVNVEQDLTDRPSVETNEVYYEFEGEISAPGTMAPAGGNLYLISFEPVVKIDGELYRCTTDTNYKYIQIAWWATEAGRKYNGISVIPNSLAIEADQFQSYILAITNTNSVKDLVQIEQEYHLRDENGNIIETGTIVAPEIKYEPMWNEDANQNGEVEKTDKPTVSFEHETNQYVIGPFSINYVKEGAEIDGRKPVEFSSIIGTKLITNIGELEYGKDWKFQYLDNERDVNDKSIYPNPNEVFYIRVDYIVGLTQIENLHFDFKYMNAGGEFTDLEGHFLKLYWNVDNDNFDEKPYDSDGDGKNDSIHYSNDTFIRLDSFEDIREQQLAHALRGVRWYEYSELNQKVELGPIENKAYIRVEKNVIDSVGEQVDVKDTFRFKIWIDLQDGNGEFEFETLEVNVVNGHGEATSNPVIWKGDVNPTYRVEEVETDYKNNGPWIGDLTPNEVDNVVNIQAINTKPKEGQLEIIKKSLEGANEGVTGKEFSFTVKVEGDFEYDNVKYPKGKPLVFEDVKVVADGESWVSKYFKWYGDEEPTYTVTENIPEKADFELVGPILNASGKLIENETVTAIATNRSKKTKAQIDLVKYVTNPESSAIGNPDQRFKFTVELKGNFSYEGRNYTSENPLLMEVTIKANEHWISNDIIWDEGKQIPTYTIKEIEIPNEYEFVSISNSNITSTDLKNGLTDKVTSGKNIITARNSEKVFVKGNLNIEKKSETNIDGQTDTITGKEFKFKVTVDGDFKYEGIGYTKGKPLVIENVVVTADGPRWESGEFVWEKNDGVAIPQYVVEEIIPENPDFEFISISNGEKTEKELPKIIGNLKEDKTVIITAINRGKVISNDSQLEIRKVLNSDANPELANQIYKFDVKITGKFKYGETGEEKEYTKEKPLILSNVEGEKYIQVKGDGIGWKSEKFYWSGNKAPEYEIVEVEIPENAEFVSMIDRTHTVKVNRIKGSLEKGTVVLVTATNANKTLPKEGNIEIVKSVTNTDLQGKEYKFSVEITGITGYYDIATNEYVAAEKYSNTVTVKPGEENKWGPLKVKWESEKNPEYTIKEVEIPEGVKIESISNGSKVETTNTISGIITETEKVIIKAINAPIVIYEKGFLQIKKDAFDENGDPIHKTFKFNVTVGEVTTVETVVAGTTLRLGPYTWIKGEKAPEYRVEEIENKDPVTGKENYEIKYKNETGTIKPGEDQIVTVEVVNTIKRKSGKLSIIKEFNFGEDKREIDSVDETFTFNVAIDGHFKYKPTTANEYKEYNGRYKFDVMLDKVNRPDGKDYFEWVSNDIIWFEEAPTYTVTEVNLPNNWQLTAMEKSSGSLVENSTVVVKCLNSWGIVPNIKVTMDLGGKVWDDTNRTIDKEVDSQEDGLIGEDEPGIKNVLVTVTRVAVDSSGVIQERLGNALVYDKNNNVVPLKTSSVYTDENGSWKLESISVPAFLDKKERTILRDRYGENVRITYDIEFEYDGQTYEPTKYLASSSIELNEKTPVDQVMKQVKAKSREFKNDPTADRDKWLKDSAVIDNVNERTEFNQSFATITGNEAMNLQGNTNGIAQGNTGTKDLYYTSVDKQSITNPDNTRKVSTLQTLNADGYIRDEMKMKSRTSTGLLTYPFDINMHLESFDKKITELPTEENTSNSNGEFGIDKFYSATYQYMLSINLGLVEREKPDSAVEKDLSTAMVVVNGKATKYKYNKAIDLDAPENKELLYKQLEVDNQGIEYELGLYSSDYYYRASIYDGTEAGTQLENQYAKLGLPLESSEMDVYLTYLIRVHNESDTFDLQVNSLSDYYDNKMTLIVENEEKYLQDQNGEEVNAKTVVAEPSKAILCGSDNQEISVHQVIWNQDSNSITGSDGVTYNKMTTDSLQGINIPRGGRFDVYVTYKVDKDQIDGIANSINLGKRYNVAEVSSFSSYYTDASKNLWFRGGEVTGRVDDDSAPNNINIAKMNEKKYYEDDTDSAPAINLTLNTTDRAIEGKVFEDARTETVEKQTVGDGVYNPDKGDKDIQNVNTEIVQVVRVPEDNGNYKEYEFEWPTEEPRQELGNKTINELTGFSQETVTDKNGNYKFTAVPAGNYKVRFTYGDKKIETGNEKEQVVYNGQDYKSTAYQVGFDNDTQGNNGYIDNQWHDLNNKDLTGVRVSDARDNEARRLFITSKSEVLTHENASQLATADDKGANHGTLFGNTDNGPMVNGDGYYMYADTAKLNITVENLRESNPETSGVDIKVLDGKTIVNGKEIPIKEHKYVIKNLDFGIETRPKSKIVLDKQIKEMIIRTSSNEVILDAYYDIKYDVKDDNTVVPTVRLDQSKSIGTDKVAGLNKSNSSQGYRYINIDKQILQGTTLEVKYQLAAFNLSEVDRSSPVLKELWEKVNSPEAGNELDNALAMLSTNEFDANGKVYGTEPVEYGKYFGSVYYLGTKGKIDKNNNPEDNPNGDVIVETKIRQVLDYVDNDVVFGNDKNIAQDNAWSNIEIQELLDQKLIDPGIVKITNAATGDLVVADGKYVTAADRPLDETTQERYVILDDKFQEYVTESRNNLVVSNDSSEFSDGSNPNLNKFVQPYKATGDLNNSSGIITLNVSRYYASENDGEDIENLAEIIKTENTVGRRNIKSIAGNLNPFMAQEFEGAPSSYKAAMAELDSSATEMITLSEPTGINPAKVRNTQMIVIILVSTVILAVGVVIIKKKVVDKK